MVGDGDIKISKLINALNGGLLIDVISRTEAEIIEVLRIYLEHNVLSTVFEKINIDLGEPINPEVEKVEYITKNVRYLDYVNMCDNHNILDRLANIFKNLNRLSTLQVPVVELSLGLRCNNYDDLNDYLILDTLDSELDSQLVNDNQALYLLNLQQLLEEYNVKSNGLTDGVYDRIKYCIPAYFKVTIKIEQE